MKFYYKLVCNEERIHMSLRIVTFTTNKQNIMSRRVFYLFLYDWKRPLGRLRHRWELNIKMDLRDLGCDVWSELSWIRIESNVGL
jgi:hypothetical protein